MTSNVFGYFWPTLPTLIRYFTTWTYLVKSDAAWPKHLPTLKSDVILECSLSLFPADFSHLEPLWLLGFGATLLKCRPLTLQILQDIRHRSSAQTLFRMFNLVYIAVKEKKKGRYSVVLSQNKKKSFDTWLRFNNRNSHLSLPTISKYSLSSTCPAKLHICNGAHTIQIKNLSPIYMKIC